MIDFLKSFKSLVKVDQVRADNNVFKLHSKFTVILLIVFSVLLTSKQYFGDPISCNVDSKDHKDVMEKYCWVFGTYVLENTIVDSDMPGLGNSHGKPVLWQTYYQWVCVVFCLQALLFYTPCYLWKSWEGGRLRLLVKDLSGPLITPQWGQELKREVAQYLLSGRHSHNLYAVRYTFCEILNLINVVSQIGLMDWFLTGRFSLYGALVATASHTRPMQTVFPRMAKCNMSFVGPSGGRQVRDAMCILPLNMLNEKLFLILWFWLYILTVITLLALVYRLFVIAVPRIRMYLLMAQTRFIGIKQAKCIISELSYGDFFLLYHVGKNINPIVFKDLVIEIYESIKAKKSYRYFDHIEANLNMK